MRPNESFPSTSEIAERWNRLAPRIAAAYGPCGDAVREHLINPDIFTLLGDVTGLHVLDAGCGEGYLCRLLAERGAHVTGVDLSHIFLQYALAREQETPLGIRYLEQDYQKLDFPDGSFDRVVSNMVLMDLSDYRGAIRESARVLAPQGMFVSSILHPCFITPDSGWCEVSGDRPAWHVDAYFRRECVEQTSPAARPPYNFDPSRERPPFMFHRPLCDYFTALADAGFVITGLREAEAGPDDPDAATAAPGGDQIPWFLIIRAAKAAPARRGV
jgi:SAM-dependent methyltransferase